MGRMEGRPGADETASRGRSDHKTRADIQGLRAVAVLLVCLNHAGVSFLPGGYVGVDVFFVVSGFLITGWLLRRVERGGGIAFGAFYAARARRILPAATLTLVATIVVCWYALNFVRAIATFQDARWAAFFAANVHFAQVGTDYFARDNPPSPLQHFWTLAVEEQFYLVWPLLLSVALVVMRRRLRSGRADAHRVLLRRLAPLVALGIAASFAYSVESTAADPVGAYFSSVARAWELGVGALLAVAAAEVATVPAYVRRSAGWLGLAAILLAGVLYTRSTPFPGYAALLPVLGSALVIAGGLGGMSRQGAGRVLGVRPMTVTGDISYSLYLWHWPVLVIAAEHAGHPFSTGHNLVLLAGAYILSLVTYRLYENPIRYSRLFAAPTPALTLWPVSVSIVLLLAAWGIRANTPPVFSAAPASLVAKPSAWYGDAVARSVSPGQARTPVPASLGPAVYAASKEHESGCVTRGVRHSDCTLGDESAGRRIIVYGDSHAAAMMPAFEYYANTRGWTIVPLITAGCTTGTASETATCRAPYEAALSRARDAHARAVIIAQYFDPREPPSATYAGVRNELADFAATAPRVILMEDPPTHTINPIDCLLTPGVTYGDCMFHLTGDRRSVYANVEQIAAQRGAAYVHTLQWFCSGGTCPLVVDGTLTFRDTNHITHEYAGVIARPLARRLDALLPPARR
jgi:peptidoglycan/LPS O-acetylase OafA/YrhL